MFIVFLKFSTNKSAAPGFMAAHKAWIEQGFAEGVFQGVGSLVPAAGGFLLAHGETRALLEARVGADPFIENNVVTAEITEIDLNSTVTALDFLKG